MEQSLTKIIPTLVGLQARLQCNRLIDRLLQAAIAWIQGKLGLQRGQFTRKASAQLTPQIIQGGHAKIPAPGDIDGCEILRLA